MAADSGNQDGRHIAHQIGNMLLYMQIHIPVWSDLSQFHHPQTDKWKTACNLSDRRTTPPPWGRCARGRSTDRPGDKMPYHPRPSQTLQRKQSLGLRPGPWSATAAAGAPVGPLLGVKYLGRLLQVSW